MTALASMAHLDLLVFPKFILDPGIGTHFLRARGPFLQAVANGVALNALGLIALDAFGRKRLPLILALPLLSTLPIAIVATETRSVWLSFALSIALLLVWTPSARIRMVCAAFVVAGGLGLALFIAGSSPEDARERLLDGETVDFRMAAYDAGWEMFVERPVLGWGSSRIQTELADRIRGFHGDVFAVHNTYFEILLEYGIVGFLLYAWVLVELIHLGRSSTESRNDGFLQNGFRGKLWRLLLAVYLINATFVVMNYQFVNGLLFTIAGILARDVCQRTRKRQWPMGAAVA
jgi:O-antigen ligase